MDMLFPKELGKKIGHYACVPLFFPVVSLRQQFRAFLWLSENQSKGTVSPLTIVHTQEQVSVRSVWLHLFTKTAHKHAYSNPWISFEIPRSSSKVLFLNCTVPPKKTRLAVMEVCPSLWSSQKGLSALTCSGLHSIHSWLEDLLFPLIPTLNYPSPSLHPLVKQKDISLRKVKKNKQAFVFVLDDSN